MISLGNVSNASNVSSQNLDSSGSTTEFAPIPTIEIGYANTDKQKAFLSAWNQYINALNAAIQDPSNGDLITNLHNAGLELADMQAELKASSDPDDQAMSQAFNKYINFNPGLYSLMEATESPYYSSFDIEKAVWDLHNPLMWEYTTKSLDAFSLWSYFNHLSV